MKPLDELRAAKPAYLDASTSEETRARELNYAFAQPREQRKDRKGGMLVWGGISLAGAAAAVIAIAVLASGTQAPAPHKTAASGIPAAKVVQLDPRATLVAVAEKLEAQPDATGTWWHSVTIDRNLAKVKGAGYSVYDTQKSETWTPLRPGGQQWISIQRLGFTFPTDADKAAWQAAGSPATVQAEVPGPKGGASGKGVKGYELSSTPGPVRTDHNTLVDGDKVFWLGKNVTMNDLLSLPGDPAALKRWLLNSYAGHSTEAEGDPMGEDLWLFTVARGLITSMPVKAKVRAAAFRMLADLKTIKVVDGVTDANGRTATAVTINQKTKMRATDKAYTGESEERLIFNKTTGQALQDDNVVVKPGGYQAGMAPGSIWHVQTVDEYGWTDANPY